MRAVRQLPRGAAALLAGVGVITACTPRARPLAGAPAPAATRLPTIALGANRERLVFRWRYEEPGFSARGEGAARVAPPDSARLDFLLDGGFGGGWAVLVGSDLRTPDDNVARRLVPPAPMLWAALGRLALPSASDTTVTLQGDTLRADVAAGALTWRVTIVGGALRGLERLQSGRVVERMVRRDTSIRYDDLSGRRVLSIDVQRREQAPPFPPSIWTR